MIHFFKVVAAYARNSMKISIQSTTGALVFLVGKLLRFGLTFFFIYVLVQKTKLLAGYTLEETMLFYLTFNIIDSLSQQLYREVYRFRPLIISGDFDTILVKPIHPFARVLVGGIDVLDFVPTLLYVCLVGWILQGMSITISEIGVYLLLLANGFILATAFHILVLSFGIISTEVDHTIMIYRDTTRIAAFPIDIYSEPLRSILTFAIPIGVMMSFPVKGILGLLEPGMIAVSIGIALLTFSGALAFWNYALARYQSASS